MYTLRARKAQQSIAYGVLWLMAGISVAIMLLVVGYVVIEGFGKISLDFFTTSPRGGLSGEGGIYSTIVTTVLLVVVTMFIATPLGVCAGIFLVEYADYVKNKAVAFLVGLARFGVETLAGVPSIIFGLFGYALFVTAMGLGFSVLAAAMAGACLVIPVVIRTTEESLKTVPDSFREGSLALGASRWETVRKVILPSALPGVTTGLILSVGRIVSETAIFYVTLGGSYRTPNSLLSSGRTMALHVFYLAMETRAFDKAMATGAVLVALIVILNLIVNTISGRLSSEMK
ncbi:phosphate ABC transporter permease PstA [Candidatus Fermentibacteria bacterium]|nr:phosphate ABC transporter permease PstA [Candidatus Fermentibacteria bacterium]